MVPERQIRVTSLQKFINMCREQHWPNSHIVDQLMQFVTDSSPQHDNCWLLRDGESNCLVKERYE